MAGTPGLAACPERGDTNDLRRRGREGDVEVDRVEWVGVRIHGCERESDDPVGFHDAQLWMNSKGTGPAREDDEHDRSDQKAAEWQAHGVFLILRGEAVQHDAQRGNLTGPVLAMTGPVGSTSRSFHLVHE